MSSQKLNMTSSVRAVHGIGPAAEKGLQRLGIVTVADLLNLLPRSYDDYTNETPLAEAVPGREGFFHVEVVSSPERYVGRSGVPVLSFAVQDGSGGTAQVTLFHQSYLVSRLRSGSQLYMHGTPNQTAGSLRFTAPRVLTRPPDTPLVAVYPAIEGLRPSRLRRIIKDVLDNVEITEPHSEAYLRRYSLPGLRSAYRSVHLPDSPDMPEQGLRRFHADRCFTLARTLDALAARRDASNETPVRALDMLDDFCRHLPFRPTNAQIRAMRDIARDLDSPHVMNRLLQGDVGSGKTAVALFAAYAVMRGGYQAIYLAPTEVLAQQQYTAALRLFPQNRVFLLTGQTPGSERKCIREHMQSSTGTLLIGTHALLYGDLDLVAPALLITDEQHRFGVRQRRTLLNSGDGLHSLTMSATPIPRSLALAIHGQTNVSVLDEMPSGRIPTKTSYVPPHKTDAMYAFIAERAAAGQQSFIVCASIEPGENTAVRSATEIYEMLSQRYPGISFGLLHGRCAPEEKTRTMRRFADGSIQVLVSTTVIEVGVDVPNATVMVILDADRFGLAQLHQLRGRVGRGNAGQSYCFLSTADRDAIERIRILCSTNDGFKIAEEDLKERGAGDFLGERQHGRQSALSLLTAENSSQLAAMRRELQKMSADSALAQDYAFFTQLADAQISEQLSYLALN